MSKKIRNLLSEIDKKFKDSEEVSSSLLFIKQTNSESYLSLYPNTYNIFDISL